MIDRFALGLSTYGLGFPLHPTGLDALREAGFSCIEYALFFCGTDVDHCALGEQVGATAAAAGLDVWSVHSPLDELSNIASLNEPARRHAVGCMTHALEVAQGCGARWVIVHSSGDLAREDNRERALSQAVRSINELYKRASQRGVGLAIENLTASHLASTADEIAWILEMMDGEAGICLDSGHACMTGQLEALLGRLGSRIVTLHLSDNDGIADDHLPPGAGAVDWAALFGGLEACGYCGPLMWELAPATVTEVADWPHVVKALRSVASQGRP